MAIVALRLNMILKICLSWTSLQKKTLEVALKHALVFDEYPNEDIDNTNDEELADNGGSLKN